MLLCPELCHAVYSILCITSSMSFPPMSFYYNLPTLFLPNCPCPFFHMSKPPLSTPLYAVSYAYHPRWSLNSSEDFLFFSVTLHIHRTIIIHSCPALPSPLLPLPRPHYHTEQHSSHTWTILPFVSSENSLEVSKGRSSLTIFHPHLIPATMLSSTPLAALITSPK